jgi:hypothetical protein
MDYILKRSLSESDINFLNETTIKFEIFDTHGLKPETQLGFDSGWCDASTGARIIGKNDRAMFKNVSEPESTLLLLKFGDRLLEMNTRLNKIYNVKEEQ